MTRSRSAEYGSPETDTRCEETETSPRLRKFAWAMQEHGAPMLSRSAAVATDTDWERTADRHAGRMLAEALKALSRNPSALQDQAIAELLTLLGGYVDRQQRG
jgi:hypothetical protein